MNLVPKATAKLLAGGSFVSHGSIASMNKLSGSSAGARSQEPIKIKFTDGWRQGAIEAWYTKQPSTKLEYLEYRKERVSPYYHEFIVVDLGNETVCRFDRRGDIDNRANVLIGEPIPSEDTAHVIAKDDKDFYPDIENNSDLQLRVHFPKGEDILTILAICFGIQMTKATEAYSLTRYNCYFFSWMIITGTARHTVEWDSLARENDMWEALVAAVMKRFSPDHADSGPLAAPKAAITAVFGNKNKANPSVLTPFVGSAYLCSTLREALVMTREQIRKSLAELIIQSTVDKAMHEVSDISAQKAGNKAARDHAAQAANDAAMEAVIETMWRDLISSQDGGSLWETRCSLAKACVEAASTAAADAMGYSRRLTITPADPTGQTQSPAQSPAQTPALSAESEPTPPAPAADGTPTPAPPARWETAWEGAWEKRWAEGPKPTGESDPKADISDRAKAAWTKAWDDALKANEQYVPLISSGLADYVINNLPESLPEVLKYETDKNTLTKMVKGMTSGTIEGHKNSELQEWVKGRITDHCERVFRMTAAAQQPSRHEFEETMKEVWERTVPCFPKKPEIEVVGVPK